MATRSPYVRRNTEQNSTIDNFNRGSHSNSRRGHSTKNNSSPPINSSASTGTFNQFSAERSEHSERGALGFGHVLLGLIMLAAFYPLISWPLPLREQTMLAGGMILLAALVSVVVPQMRMLVVVMSLGASFRYIYWRAQNTLSMGNTADAAISILLFAAEIYGVLVLLLGYIQTFKLQRRKSAPLPADESLWPTVDVFITTYNESTDILRRTVVGALAMDYPKKTVYLLDDGRRQSVRALAEELGCEYITRPDNRHAKAGNINNALPQTSGELIAFFDADHVPVKSFLKETVGFFTNPKIALVQTPHHFYNADPFERNLKVEGKVAPEGDFFYQVAQVGNDHWNSAYFCGSCAVLRRSALLQVGGMATETVTEDAHTSMRIHAAGYDSVYYPKPLAAGLAAEKFSYYVAQRMRWARGMVQILRVQNPLLTRGLKLAQRLTYFTSMIHFFYGIPRLVFILAPLTYLLFGLHPVKGLGIEVLMYALPHIVLATIAMAMISGNFRHSFWAEIFETATAAYLAPVTLLAMISPRLGRFNVTAKGGLVDQPQFDFKHASPVILLIILSVASLVALPLRWITLPGEHSSIVINGVWALYNLGFLVAAALAARNRPQQRYAPRVGRRYPCMIILPNGNGVSATTIDLSDTGARLVMPRPYPLTETFSVKIDGKYGDSATLQGNIIWRECDHFGRMTLGVAFDQQDSEAHQGLIRLIFSDPDSWIERKILPDRPFRSYWYILTSIFRLGDERRISTRIAPRFNLATGCHIITESGRSFAGTTVNVSDSGAGICIDSSAWPLPNRVSVQLQLRGSEYAQFPARVVRSGMSRGGPIIGVAFEDISFEELVKLGRSIYGGKIADAHPLAPEQKQTTRLEQAAVFEYRQAEAPCQQSQSIALNACSNAYAQPTASLRFFHNPLTVRSQAEYREAEQSVPVICVNPQYESGESHYRYEEPARQNQSYEEPAQRAETITESAQSYCFSLPMPPAGALRTIGNSQTGAYYSPGDPGYNQLLISSLNGRKGLVFFNSDQEAIAAGYRRPGNDGFH